MRAAPGLPDVLADLQTFWLLTDFSTENGGTHSVCILKKAEPKLTRSRSCLGTHIVPGTQRAGNNPNSKVAPFNRPRPTERQVVSRGR
jgi:hypothetical protein